MTRRTTDGCYSWMVLAVSFLFNLLTIGFIFGSIGALVAKYNEEFHVDIRTSSWTGSILTGVLLFSGKPTCMLVSAALNYIHSCR